ncbi:MAG: class I SAM-dependent methyltransferase [Chloroflexota bacterium]|nr:class I SAM-dependent methyltransferase [Chloroflexota bacterium]
MYSDAEAAALYNLLNPWGASDDVYLSLVMGSPTVLDGGCGTGTMLHRARSAGHTGRLVGIDPDRAALARARQRNDIEWNEGTAASMT